MTRVGLLALVGLLVICAIVIIWSGGDSEKDPNQGKTITLDEVHPCDTNDPFGVQGSLLSAQPTQTPVPPTHTKTATPSATSTAGGSVTDTSAGGTTRDGCTAPDFSQRCALWGSDE